MVEQQEKEEKEQVHSLLKEICAATFYTDKKVSFVGVVDNNGKLLVGEFRERTSKEKGITSPIYIKPTLFYSCFLTAGLEKWKAELRTTESDNNSNNNNNSDLHFTVLELGILKLDITPLTRRGELYPCICVKPSAFSQQIISRISKAIY